MSQYIEHGPDNAVFFDPPVSVTEMHYILGTMPPNYPLPSLLGPCRFYPECVVIYTADDEISGITWWNETYGLPLPFDHGKWEPN